MKSMQQSVADIQQNFWTSSRLPFLEIRTTHHSLHSYAAHFHRSLSVGFILEGQTQLTYPGASVIAHAGDMVLIEPELVHSCNPVEGKPRSYHMLFLDADWCRAVHDAQKGDGFFHFPQRVVHDPKLFQSLTKLIESVCQNSKNTMHENELESLLKGLLEKHYTIKKTEDSAKKSYLELRLLQNTSLGNHKSLPVTILARAMGRSRENFIRSVHSMTGLPPGKYQHCLRLEAGRLLLKSGATITEAALATGYADQSHFHRMFVKYFSATPRQYQTMTELPFK